MIPKLRIEENQGFLPDNSKPNYSPLYIEGYIPEMYSYGEKSIFVTEKDNITKDNSD